MTFEIRADHLDPPGHVESALERVQRAARETLDKYRRGEATADEVEAAAAAVDNAHDRLLTEAPA